MPDRTPTGDLPRCADCTCPNPGACPEQPAPLRDQLAEALEPVTLAATPAEVVAGKADQPGQRAVVPSPAAFDALVDAVLPVVEAALTEQPKRLRTVSEEHRCESVHPERDLRCTRASGHVAHVNGGDGWSCACDVNTQRAEQAEAAVQRVRRMAQVWIDIQPTHQTLTNEAHAIAYAGEQVIAALDQPEEPR